MKKLVILVGFNLAAAYLYGQDFYMYIDGQKQTYAISNTKMLIKLETLDTANTNLSYNTFNIENTIL